MKVKTLPPNKAGFRLDEFVDACGFSRGTYYALPKDQQPTSVKVGRLRIVTESPAEFLQRLAQMQRAAA